MRQASRLVGRERERAELNRLLGNAREGLGELVLVGGEAGVGKSRLVREVLREEGVRGLSGAGTHGEVRPYGPVVQALRSHLRSSGHDAGALGPLAPHLATLLPELATSSRSDGDRATLFEAIRCAFFHIASEGPLTVFLDDLQWADDTTLELLLALREGLGREPLLLIGAYRSDEVPRGHPMRRLRTELRRAGHLVEIALGPLSPEDTTSLAGELLGRPPAPSLSEVLYDRSQGVPFFLEELVAALVEGGRLRDGPDGPEAVPGGDALLPESVRDAVLVRRDGLSDEALRALEVASVVGAVFDLELVESLAAGEEGLVGPLERGLLVEAGAGKAAFRHALTREAIYHEIPWPRRRSLHREIAEHLESRGAPPDTLAAHWLAAREFEPARRALIRSAEASCHVHAYRDAVRTARRALELWPEGRDEATRLALLDRLGRCAELSGDLAEATRAWSEVSEARRRHGTLYEFADLQRRLASVYAIQGMWDGALAAHRAAAEAFAEHGLPGEAAAERLIAADHLEALGSRRAALELVRRATDEAARGGRADLEAIARGLEGQLRVELGEAEQGLEVIREGLALALDHDLAPAAAELYARLAWALAEASEYRSAGGAFQTALDFCQAKGIQGTGQACLVCFAGVLLEIGEWRRANAICRDLLASPDASSPVPAGAACVSGILYALRGRAGPARRLLLEADAALPRHPVLGLELSTAWGLAILDELGGEIESAADRLRALRERWEQSDDLYYVVHPLRWGITFLATNGLHAESRAAANALATVASRKGSPETLAALAHALGECALLDGDAALAVEHFSQALEILGRVGMPFQHAHTQVRAGVALGAAGDRERAANRFVEAHHTARKLGARPLQARAAEGLEALGESVERRLGRRAARRLEQAGLTGRELQVLRLVNEGRSNRDIAQELFLSPRTVEMHVSNALLKLGCGTRTEAAHRARELGVIA